VPADANDMAHAAPATVPTTSAGDRAVIKRCFSVCFKRVHL
jgi:hypothetical protein